MTEFNSDGFSAVAKVFGDQTDENETIKREEPSKAATGRLGLGATKPVATKTARQNDILTATLAHVSKRKRGQGDSDDETDVEDVESEDEDEGRTAISSKKIIPKADPQESDTKKKKKKKKKGKKERLEEKAAEQEKDETTAVGSDDINTTPKNDEQLPEEPKTFTEEQIKSNNELQKAKRKKKRNANRTKVRSRQKNIKKDTRRAVDKPSNIIIGRSDYCGRDLTDTTREFLHMPPKRTNIMETNVSKHIVAQTNKGSDAVGGVNGGGLAIETFGETNEAIPSATDETGTVGKKPNKRGRKKAKISKYKNLRI